MLWSEIERFFFEKTPGYATEQGCKFNEELVEDERPCDSTCQDLHRTNCTTPIVNYYCKCKDGLVRNRAGWCVPPKECPEPQNRCSRNERYCPGDCVKQAEPSCEVQHPHVDPEVYPFEYDVCL
uniref:TIL domain-containing protein n=1 Tax=Acrobeloides nanus TaxID=290746 RepID=A0A914CXQ2_9BILA